MQQNRSEPSPEVDRLAAGVVDAAIEVHRQLGPGYIESVYEDALCHELTLRGIPFQRQAPVVIAYKGVTVGSGRLDILVGNLLIIELKAVESLLKIH